jgi:hypothetical protein
MTKHEKKGVVTTMMVLGDHNYKRSKNNGSNGGAK